MLEKMFVTVDELVDAQYSLINGKTYQAIGR